MVDARKYGNERESTFSPGTVTASLQPEACSRSGMCILTTHFSPPRTASYPWNKRLMRIRLSRQVWHILEILEGSPAESAGLVPFGDWIIGYAGGVLRGEGDFYDLVEAHVDTPLRLFVYNADYDVTRETILVPNRSWGTHSAQNGLLGCGVGYGLLHRIPRPQDRSRIEEELGYEEEMRARAERERERQHSGQDGYEEVAYEQGGFAASAGVEIIANEEVEEEQPHQHQSQQHQPHQRRDVDQRSSMNANGYGSSNGGYQSKPAARVGGGMV